MKFSVIVPVYNVEKYISDCIDSVLNQEYEQFELILIDDGSSDRSGEICLDYCASDSRLSYIRQANGGVSSARNLGISKATGDFIVFLDSDDMLKPMLLQTLYNEINSPENSSDLYFGKEEMMRPDGSNFVLPLDYDHELVSSYTDNRYLLVHLLAHNLPIWSVCRGAYKTEFLRKNGICFIENFTYGEDRDFLINCFIAASKITLLQVVFFLCRVSREGSITTNMSLESIKSNVDVAVHWYRYFDCCSDAELNAFKRYFANMLFDTYGFIGGLAESELAEFETVLKQHQHILAQVSGAKHKVAYRIMKIMGMRAGSKILGSLYAINKVLGNRIGKWAK